MKPQLFVRAGGLVNASWRWALVVDDDGLVHWRIYYPDIGGTLPLCYEFTGRRAAALAKRATMPTCVHCFLVPMKPIAR